MSEHDSGDDRHHECIRWEIVIDPREGIGPCGARRWICRVLGESRRESCSDVDRMLRDRGLYVRDPHPIHAAGDWLDADRAATDCVANDALNLQRCESASSDAK